MLTQRLVLKTNEVCIQLNAIKMKCTIIQSILNNWAVSLLLMRATLTTIRVGNAEGLLKFNRFKPNTESVLKLKVTHALEHDLCCEIKSH